MTSPHEAAMWTLVFLVIFTLTGCTSIKSPGTEPAPNTAPYVDDEGNVHGGTI